MGESQKHNKGEKQAKKVTKRLNQYFLSSNREK